MPIIHFRSFLLYEFNFCSDQCLDILDHFYFRSFIRAPEKLCSLANASSDELTV